MGIQQKQNLEQLFNKVFGGCVSWGDGLVSKRSGAVQLYLSDGTRTMFATWEQNQDRMSRMVRKCKEKGLYIIGIDISGDARIDYFNDWLRALGDIAGRIAVKANGYGGNYIVYLKPKH